ncbi:MAG: glycosyltransferase [Alphaproteobacteria bacterium]|nr:glycosyltransferase [Alphaproteobacteria bacterium]
MKIVWFVHTISSCWNNGNAHFLRGLGRSLHKLGHDVLFCEPCGNWSETNLTIDHGTAPLNAFRRAFPDLRVQQYEAAQPDLGALTHGADLVVVHEWNEASLVNALGNMRRRGAPFTLLFHDTHHRAATAPGSMRQFDLSGFDGVLAFGEVIAEIYRKQGCANRAWAFHEAADTTTFFPRAAERECDLVWIGNWGDEERSAELHDFLIEPAQELDLRAQMYGVRYPATAVEELWSRGIEYRGWLANHKAPIAFAKAAFAIHVPRRPYAAALRGIPTIRVFEALACGIPLICAPWEDSERLFPPGCYLSARDGDEMRMRMRDVLHDEDLRRALMENGMAAIKARHTCDHRARQLLGIYDSLNLTRAREAA